MKKSQMYIIYAINIRTIETEYYMFFMFLLGDFLGGLV